MYIVNPLPERVISPIGKAIFNEIHEALGGVNIAPSVLYFIRMYKECRNGGTSADKNVFIKNWRDLMTLLFFSNIENSNISIEYMPLNLTDSYNANNKLPSIIMKKLRNAETAGALDINEKLDGEEWDAAKAIVFNPQPGTLRDRYTVLGFTNPYIIVSPCEDFQKILAGAGGSIPALDKNLYNVDRDSYIAISKYIKINLIDSNKVGNGVLYDMLVDFYENLEKDSGDINFNKRVNL